MVRSVCGTGCCAVVVDCRFVGQGHSVLFFSIFSF